MSAVVVCKRIAVLTAELESMMTWPVDGSTAERETGGNEDDEIDC